MRRPTCSHCGAAYGRRNTEVVRVVVHAGEPAPTYRGNLQLVRTETWTVPAGMSGGEFGVSFKGGDVVYRFHTWDGTWHLPYEPFCTTRCALDYAIRAMARFGPRRTWR